MKWRGGYPSALTSTLEGRSPALLHLYSDASLVLEAKLGVASTLVFDDDAQVCKAFFSKVYGNVHSSSHAELLGIAQGLEWMIDNAKGEEYTIICDNISIIERISMYPENTKVTNGPPATLWFHVFNLLDQLKKPVIMHITSHQSEHNPNKACDMLCGRIANYIKGVGAGCTQ